MWIYIIRDKNVNAPICDGNPEHSCPDLIILGTTQVWNINIVKTSKLYIILCYIKEKYKSYK